MRQTTHTSTSTSTTNQKIIQLIQGLHQLHTTPMKAAHYQKLATYLPYPSLEEIEQRFGSWTKLLEQAGVVKPIDLSNRDRLTLNRSKSSPSRKRWTVEESITFYVETCGSRVTIRSYSELRTAHPQMMSANTIIRHYGTWKQALAHFQLSSNGFYSDEDCLNALRQAYEKIGPAITSQDYVRFARKQQLPSLTLLIERFTSWREALRILEETSR
ncbi:homing endonuclease associated repeat-containing protein [Exiguobacterium undae]